jgi:hypothetical protein
MYRLLKVFKIMQKQCFFKKIKGRQLNKFYQAFLFLGVAPFTIVPGAVLRAFSLSPAKTMVPTLWAAATNAKTEQRQERPENQGRPLYIQGPLRYFYDIPLHLVVPRTADALTA